MTEQEKREKVIEALEACVLKDPDDSRDCKHCPRCNYGAFITNSCINGVMSDALALLKRSFTPQEVYDTVIEHVQHDKRFKLGDKIDYSFTDVVDILNIELMCKAGDM